jgi:hypothetical protein
MKKLMAVILSAVILGAMALPAAAQGRRWNNSNQTYSQRTNRYPDRNNPAVYNYGRQQQARVYYDNGAYDNRAYDNRSFWDKHRDKLTTGIGLVGGALLGRAIGGGRGTAIGALAGGAGAALYTYKLRNNRWR